MGKSDDEELEKVQEKIDKARDKALDDGIISDPGHEHRYYESGDEESKQDDDQTATPG